MSKYQPINGWTKDDMIVHVLTHFKGASISRSRKTCLYRGSKGRKCAVGLFIPDSLYSPSMEGNGVSKIYNTYCDPKSVKFFKAMPLNLCGMRQLQKVHDDIVSRVMIHLGTIYDMDKLVFEAILIWIDKNVSNVEMAV